LLVHTILPVKVKLLSPEFNSVPDKSSTKQKEEF
jgi:hypothetical protein